MAHLPNEPRKPGSVVGSRVTRLEDAPLVTGRGRYIGDISFPHQLTMRVVRSSHAHGRIVSITTAAALAVPGVVAVWTHADVADLPPIPLRDAGAEALQPYLQPILARGTVRYVGEPVAVVFATDEYTAEDAAELVEVEVEELPAVVAADAPVSAFDATHSNEPIVLRKGYGDVDGAFRKAHVVVELDLVIGRHSGVPLETRGLVARYDTARDILELHGAAKVPHRNRDSLAGILGRSPASVQLIEYHVGGGFGVRGELYPDDILACVAAMRLERPVKWIEDRYEHLMTTNHSREQLHRIRAAVAADGQVLALDDEFFLDQGAYVRTHGARVADMTSGMLPGPYRIPAYRSVCRYRVTNKTPAATYRAPGRFEGTFVRERIFDAIATRLGIDPVELRRRNLITADEMPFARALDALGDEVEYDSGDYPAMLAKVLDRARWPDLQADLAARRARGEHVGAGLALFVEKSGLGPMDGVKVTVDTSGAVEVVTGSASVGQGVETAMAQICADALGVDYRRVRVVHGRTDRIAYGVGAHAARATVMTGSATHIAASKVRAKAIDMAAQLMKVPAAALEVVDGAVVRKDSADRISLGLGEIAQAYAPTSRALGDREPGLSAEGWHRTSHMTYPYGAHVAVVRVDAETGGIAVERFVVVFDVGRAVNPTMIEGQIAGGVVQGLGGTLYEEFLYDERGQPLSVTFADYLIPTAAEVPPIDILVTEDAPSPLNALGLKGAGEAGINGVGAAIAAAIDDALGIPGAVTRLPVTPERVREILRKARGGSPS
jgi:carbon-monoxide dehydrogenase large subunit